MAGPGFITHNHYAAFGRIVQAFVTVETVYVELLQRILEIQSHAAALVFSAYGYDAIKNLLKAAITESNQSEEDKVSGIKLIDKVHDKSNLRNNIAHNSWKPGRREGSIKPLVLKTKGSVLMLGTGHNEKDWTAKELHSEAEEILARVIRVADFFADRGITISAEDAND